MLQGEERNSQIQREPMLLSRFKDDTTVEIGVDEAGRGSFWGPMMAGAVVIPDEVEWTEKQQTLFMKLRDSKKISPKKRDVLAAEIKQLLPYCAVGTVSAQEINEQGVTWANKEAFRRAIDGINMEGKEACRLVVDGILPLDGWKGEQELVVEGDSAYLCVAAASILAKVQHDRWIQEYCAAHPECNEHYDLLPSKGYGTAKHREGIRVHGGHELHRTLYIQNWLPGATRKPRTYKKKDASASAEEKCLIKFTT